MKTLLQGLVGAALIAALAMPAWAQVDISIDNPSFEMPALDSGVYDATGVIPGWTGGSADPAGPDVFGIQDMGAAAETSPAADGENVLWFNGGDGGSDYADYVTQSVAPVVGGETYTLSVAVNNRQELAAVDYMIQLLVDGAVVAEDLNSIDVLASNNWDYSVLNYAAAPADDNKPMTIKIGELANNGIQTIFDDVTLVRTPEPASMTFLAIAGLALLRRRR